MAELYVFEDREQVRASLRDVLSESEHEIVREAEYLKTAFEAVRYMGEQAVAGELRPSVVLLDGTLADGTLGSPYSPHGEEAVAEFGDAVFIHREPADPNAPEPRRTWFRRSSQQAANTTTEIRRDHLDPAPDATAVLRAMSISGLRGSDVYVPVIGMSADYLRISLPEDVDIDYDLTKLRIKDAPEVIDEVLHRFRAS